jgi:hypothetical protein
MFIGVIDYLNFHFWVESAITAVKGAQQLRDLGMAEWPMRQRRGSKQDKWRGEMISGSDSGRVLEAFQVVDRMLIEFSMRLYNIPRRQRLILRGHNQRLHRAVRQGHGTGASRNAIPSCPTTLS